MTATIEREPKERIAERDSKPQLLTKEQILNPPLKQREVEILGLGRIKLRELTQYEREEVEAPVMKQESEGDKIVVRRDDRGSKARALAFALLNPDGTQMFVDALGEGVQAINRWPTRWVDPVFEVCDELSILTRGAREKMGKASGKMAGDSSS